MLDRRVQPRSQRLEKNLAALREHDPLLAERVLWTVREATVDLGMENAAQARLQQAEHTLVVAGDELTRPVAALPEGDGVFVFGIGLGEQLAHLLLMRPRAQVLAWERDPALLRQALSERDFARPLTEGRLRLALGADVLRLAGEALPPLRLDHPLLVERYSIEAGLLEEGLEGRRIALGLGGVIVDQVAVVLRALGWCVLPLELARWSGAELRHALETYGAEVVLLIDHHPEIGGICEERGDRVLVWEVNPVPAPTTPPEHVRVFTVDRGAARATAAHNVRYMPMGSPLRLRRKLDLTAEERERYGTPVCFIGSSLDSLARAYRRRLLALYGSWHEDGMESLSEGEQRLERVLAEQARDYSRSRVPELMQEHFGEFMAAARRSLLRDSPEVLVGEIVASARRVEWVRRLGKQDIHVWGDPFWATLEFEGVTYEGRAHNNEELTRAYNGGEIHVDIGRLYQPEIVTQRAFDTLACGRFLIAERTEVLEELFEVGAELEAYSSFDELADKVQHFRAHPERAREIAARGHATVCARHSLEQRLKTLLSAAD